MKILISPSKTQNFSDLNLEVNHTIPFFLTCAGKINDRLKTFSLSEIKTIMKTSDSIAQKTQNNIKNWGNAQTAQGPALFSYTGEVFKCMDINSFTKDEMIRGNAAIRILSGLYGILLPTDQIMPYRLEVKSRLSLDGYKSLYQFWTKKVTHYLLDDLGKDEQVINLASDEYSKMINFDLISNDVVKPVFKIDQDGVIKNQAIWAKKARGLFSRFLLSNHISSIEEMTLFNQQGFLFDSFDEDKGELLFIMKK